MDGSFRASFFTLSAQLALFRVDIGQIVVESDGLERTGLHALTATDTGSLANFVSHSALVAVYAHHDHSAVFRSFRSVCLNIL